MASCKEAQRSQSRFYIEELVPLKCGFLAQIILKLPLESFLSNVLQNGFNSIREAALCEELKPDNFSHLAGIVAALKSSLTESDDSDLINMIHNCEEPFINASS